MKSFITEKKKYVSFILNCDFRYSFLSIHVHVYMYSNIFKKNLVVTCTEIKFHSIMSQNNAEKSMKFGDLEENKSDV